MTYPIKIEFIEYTGAPVDWEDAEDWSDYLAEPPVLNRRVESENEGEAGVIVFDSASVTFRYDAGNPVHDVFSIDLSAKIRYVFRISAPKSDKSYTVLFEGMADFSTIEEPGDQNIINFEIVDKLSALGVIPAQPARTKYYDDYVNSGPASPNEGINPGTNTSRQVNIQKVVPDLGDQWVDITHEWWDSSIEAWIPEYGTANDITLYLEPGSLIKRENEYVIVKQAALIDIPGSQYKAIRAEIQPVFEPGFIFGTLSAYCEVDGRFPYWSKELWGIDCNNLNGNILKSLDGIKAIEALYNQAWPGETITLKPDTFEFPIPSEYAVRFIDENPLGGTPLDALKTLADSMRCYIYCDHNGDLVIQSKAALATNGTTRTIGTTPIISSHKKYFWDKLADGVSVTAKSWLLDGGNEYITGNASVSTQVPGSGFIKPKNQLRKELLVDNNSLSAAGITLEPDGSLSDPLIPSGDQEEILNRYAVIIAQEYLNFYGKRRSSRELTLKLDNNTIEWDLVDNIEIDSVDYFFTSADMDLAGKTISLTLVEVTGHQYDYRQVVVGLSEANSLTVNSGSSFFFGGVINQVNSDYTFTLPLILNDNTVSVKNLASDTGDIIAFRDGTTPQEIRIYNSYDGANNELVSFGFKNQSNVFTIEAEQAGTGTIRDMAFLGSSYYGFGTIDFDGTPPAGRVVIKASTNDGSTNALVCRDSDEVNIFTVDSDGNIIANAAAAFKWNGSSVIKSPADGTITLLNNALNSFGLLQFGGTSNSYPGIKRNNAEIQFRLGDDSDYANIYAKDINVINNIGTTDYASQLTGWRVTNEGSGDFRYLYTDELHAKAFIADLEQALAGSQIICKSVAKVAVDCELPPAGSSGPLVV
ncbi:MAG: hypothetical protein R6W90_08505, partial [Ignavibacteriaceae bacterium]